MAVAFELSLEKWGLAPSGNQERLHDLAQLIFARLLSEWAPLSCSVVPLRLDHRTFGAATMDAAKVERDRVRKLLDLPNIGPAMARALQLIGISMPKELVGKDPFKLYQELCLKVGFRHDPCVLDVFISLTRFMDGDEPKRWWAYTEERKQRHGSA